MIAVSSLCLLFSTLSKNSVTPIISTISIVFVGTAISFIPIDIFEMDKKIKDQPMRSNADSKEAQLKSLIVLQKILRTIIDVDHSFPYEEIKHTLELY